MKRWRADASPANPLLCRRFRKTAGRFCETCLALLCHVNCPTFLVAEERWRRNMDRPGSDALLGQLDAWLRRSWRGLHHAAVSDRFTVDPLHQMPGLNMPDPWCWCSTTAPSTPARQAGRPWPGEHTGSRWSGCQSTRPSATARPEMSLLRASRLQRTRPVGVAVHETGDKLNAERNRHASGTPPKAA